MLSRQEEQEERLRTLANDERVREQQRGTTFHQFAQADAEIPGRFSAVANAYVVGSTAIPQYPQASTPFQHDPVPDEPPLAPHENPALEPSMHATDVEVTGPASAPSTPLGQRDVGSLSQTDDPATGGPAPLSASPRAQRGGAASSGFRRRV